MEFSNRTPADLTHNRITKTLERLSGKRVLDLTLSNPTQCGFDYPPALLEPLGHPRGRVYEASPFGSSVARNAVAEYLRTKGHPAVDPANILLTASTSEAYSYLFKLLGNPGDSFLVPAPSYPLLDHLIHLEGLEALPYPFQTKPGWPVNLPQVQKTIRTDTKGLIVVNPQNPTGCFLSSVDQKALAELCQKHDLAYISDEVFSDYAYDGSLGNVKNAPAGGLSFRLGGLSKSLGLPQLKLSWVVFEGPAVLLEPCRERLELIADTYLSVNTPVQGALKELFGFAPLFQKQLLERVLANRSFLEAKLQGLTVARLWPSEGGWYALVEVLGLKISDEDLVIELLKKHQVLVQPGGFYDFSEGCFLILSLLPEQPLFKGGAMRLIEYLRTKEV